MEIDEYNSLMQNNQQYLETIINTNSTSTNLEIAEPNNDEFTSEHEIEIKKLYVDFKNKLDSYSHLKSVNAIKNLVEGNIFKKDDIWEITSIKINILYSIHELIILTSKIENVDLKANVDKIFLRIYNHINTFISIGSDDKLFDDWLSYYIDILNTDRNIKLEKNDELFLEFKSNTKRLYKSFCEMENNLPKFKNKFDNFFEEVKSSTLKDLFELKDLFFTCLEKICMKN